MIFGTKRVRWMIQMISDSLRINDQQVSEYLKGDKAEELVKNFVDGNGSRKLMFYYQMEDQGHEGGREANTDYSLFITNGDSEKLKDKAVVFLRNLGDQEGKRGVKLDEDQDSEVLFLEVNQNILIFLNNSMEYVYQQFVERMDDQNWEQCEKESIDEFVNLTKKFGSEVHDAIKSMDPGQDQFCLDPEELNKYNGGPDTEKMQFFEKNFSQWLNKINDLLNDDREQKKDQMDAGPLVEIEFWRTRMQKITTWCEQLKGKDFNTVKNAFNAKLKAHEVSQRGAGNENISKLLNDYNRLDLQLTDKLNEAKDNFKYLSTLEKFIEPLYRGTPEQIIETLPALMNTIKMIHTIARFYNTADKMTSLFMKITNQMITNCKNRILDGKKSEDIWNRDPAKLIQVLESCIRLNKAYKDSYKETKDKVADMQRGSGHTPFDFTETQIFGKFDLLCRRVAKLIEIFTTIQQFQSLAKHNLENMEELTNSFQNIIKDFQSKRHDLMDYAKTNFDLEYVKFTVEIQGLDSRLQSFIDENFSRFRNIEYSIRLLHKFENTLKRNTLRHSLTNKYNSILQTYATELDNIQRIFTEKRGKPNIVRNMPSDAGKIIWAKHLFQKITAPISLFPDNLLKHGEIKKYYGSYNNLGKQLTVYEMWYYQNWTAEIEKSKAALQATLIVRSEDTKHLFVNFDIEIMQLIREAKCLDRFGVGIPESARIILLQEEKFKLYYNELQYAIREHQRIIQKIKPITKNLLASHLEDLELKLRPGMVTLTWTSMNIDSYLEHVHAGLNKLEQLIINVNDIIENRIENNLKAVSKILLVSLPSDSNKPFSLEQFVRLQEEFIVSKTTYLISKNLEIERAVDDLLQTIILYPLDSHVEPIQPEETRRIKRYYFWYLYQALLNSTQNSLNAMKYRVCGKRQVTSIQESKNQDPLKPFFEVHVKLDNDTIILNPSLDQIQKAINKAATAVLRCSKYLYNWEQQDKNSDNKASLYEMIAQDKEIVKVILLLTGSIQGTRQRVNEFKLNFNKFDHLWKQNIEATIKEFEKKNPSLQDYEDKLKKYTSVEEDIDKIQISHLIGAMELKTEGLCDGLRRWSKEWKNKYSENLHKKAKLLLDNLTEQTKNLDFQLRKEVNDIDSLGSVMETLEQIRVIQAEIDMKFTPVNEMYNLLENYLPNGLTDKEELDARTMLNNNWESVIKFAESKQKELQQKQTSYLVQLKQDIAEFIKTVKLFRQDYEINGPMVDNIKPKDAIERCRRFDDEFFVNKNSFNVNKKGEDLFGLQNQKYPELEKTESELKNLKKLYKLYSEVIESISKWKERAWCDFGVEMLNEMTDQVMKYGDMCMRLPKDLKEWNAYKELKTEIDTLKDVLPIIIDIKKQNIKDRHWKQICEITGKQLDYEHDDIMNFNDLLEAKLLNFTEEIIDIIDSADKQQKIEKQLKEIEDSWKDYEFEFNTWGSRDYPCVLAGLKVGEIIEKLDEDNMSLTTINAQRHVGPFKEEVEKQIRVFAEINETLELWIKVQMLWSSLEAVFTGGDIAKQMPGESRKFQQIDKTWTKLMEKAVETKKIIPCCQYDILKQFLPDLYKNLEICQKSLEQYLEGKRKKFPRLYFVSDPTLLKILSQGSDPKSIQEDFEKLFDAINRVIFDKNQAKKGTNEQVIKAIIQIIGKDEEVVFLQTETKCEGLIESWLTDLERQMQITMKDIIRQASSQVFNSTLTEFIKSQISQVALLGLQISWTAKMTEAFEKASNKNEKGIYEQKKKEINGMMEDLTKMCLEEHKSQVDRVKVETLVTIMVHQKELTAELKCKDVNEFDWQKQTRVYWKQELDNCIISVTDWDAPYCYEFLGAKERLCITKLTDRCYITLAQAMSMYYGGAPAGPAGTGKTETVKDLGRTLGIFVVVTNCSDQQRYRDMAQIFKGLVQSGLWGCFDEFNRIHLDVLSVVAMQVESISSAKKAHVQFFDFPEEKGLQIIQSVGYFITMNPGYAGRQELPENLKVLFRSVSMMVPDRETIIKVKLASVGFATIESLAKKFNILYKLCEEQLSKQRHYDFGLRNILSVLRTAGNTIKQERPKNGHEEEMLMMRALRDMNLSKLVADDIPLFNSLLVDIFPKQTNVPKMMYNEVENAVKQTLESYNLILYPPWLLKIVQVYETSLVRHGFMLIGPTGSGKTTIINALTESLHALSNPHRITRINPKAITTEEMYGVKSEISDDWIPGIFSTIWSKSNNRNNKFSTWITFDGPVDTLWIESLNTVLDDNKILTLANGERIPMTENCKLVFEVENLNNASPATVSRCGQVYISSTDLGYESVIKGYCIRRKAEQNQNDSEKLKVILTKWLIQYEALQVVEKLCKNQIMYLDTICYVTNCLNLLTGILLPYKNTQVSDQDLEKLVCFSLSWALVGTYENSDRQLFNEWMISKNASFPQKMKEGETVFDYFLDSSKGGCDWKLIQPDEWKPPEKNFQFSQLLLPTVDSFRAEILINCILSQTKQLKNPLCQKSVLLIGTGGTAKTSSVLMFSDKLGKKNQLFKRINFSSATRPSHYQANIEVECEFKVGKDFAPNDNKTLNVFIDDISMPEVNSWGDQETLEIVRQLIETGGFYMLDKSQRGTFKNIKNLQFIGAMNHPIGGRNDIPNRAKRNFFIFNMILPQSVESIYLPIIKFVFKPKNYSNEFNTIIDILPYATAALWNKVKSNILPTPSKFHYIFNMRELSRIFKGFLQIRRDVIIASNKFDGMKQDVFAVALWRHECERVFCDKLVSQKDKDIILNYIQEVTQEHFQHIDAEVQEKLTKKEKYIYFCDFLREDVISEEGYIEELAEKVYEGINDLGKLRDRCTFLLEQYNNKFVSKKMNLVLFDDAIKHLLKISRVIQMQRSSALLVGVGGSGKQSLTRLAAEIGRQQIYQIVITKHFQEKDLKEELKAVYDIAGHLGKKITFIMTDQEVKKEDFLEYINMLLSTGEIPGLLQKDDREIWLGDITNDYMKERGQPNTDPTSAQLYQYLVDRLRDNLHIVLCFSPVGSKFRDRARKFPALFNECSINWFLPWPEEALVSVASSYINNFKELDTKKETKIELQKHMGNVHLMVQQVCELYFLKMRRRVWVTPKSFLSYLNLYQKYYLIKYQELDVQEKSYKKGLGKIEDASKSIAIMEIQLKEEEAILKQAAESTDTMLKELDKEKIKVNKKQQEVALKTAQCQKQAEQIQSEKTIAEKELEAAMPALLAADQAVRELDKKDIDDLKANKNPMTIIKYILDSVAVFFKEKLLPVHMVSEQLAKKDPGPTTFIQDSFTETKSILNDPNFRNNLQFFERDNINEETMELLSAYTSEISPIFNHFNYDSASKISKAAAGILKWVLAIQEYHLKSKIVKPRKINLAISEGKLSSAMVELKANQSALEVIQAQMAELEAKFNKQMEEKMGLEQKMNKTKKKINTARSLIGSLQDERDRWSKGDSEIGEQKRRLVGNVSIACAFISYCGPFNSEFRDILSHDYFSQDMKKRGVPLTPDMNLVNFLVDEATVGEWNIQGLPKDDLSIQNGIMVTNSSRFPLLIDPQVQGENWIKNKYAETIDQFRSITTLNNPKFKDFYLKYCMEEGKTIIIQGIENEVDPIIDPVLEKQIIKKGKNYVIDVGGTQMDYNANFTLFMTCRLPNPSFSPELSAKTTIIDFTVTQKGLEQQLLSRVLSKEQKALEDSLKTLLANVNKNKKDLQILDKNLLDRLMSSTGNLLDDTELMDVLNMTKTQAKEVAVKLVDAEQKTKLINESREQYRPVAIRGSALYFCIIELQYVNWMYNSSLEQFLTLFDYSIDNSEKVTAPTKRVEIIIKYLTLYVYKYINRGLFEKDKTTFVLMVCFKIMQTANKISAADISCFLKSGASLDLRSERSKPFNFIADKIWLNLLALSRHHFSGDNIAFFRDLPDTISRNEVAWKQFTEKNEPENQPIPDYAERIASEKEIGPFIQLCLIRSLREDRSLVACQQYISGCLGKEFTDPISYPIEGIWAESFNDEPIIFLLSAGADPTSSIDELAKKKKKTTMKVSMGEGQEKVAMVALYDGFANGNWVILQNCHLGLKLMEDMMGILHPDKEQTIHEDFRLWITCEPIDKFPLSLLQNSIKVTDEAPKGLRAGVFKTFTTMINQDFIDKIDHSYWRSLIFVLCFMHSIVIERKKFGPIGWCVPYEYNNSDLEASLMFIEKYLNSLIGPTQTNVNLPVNCNVLKYMIGEVQYGGRITDDLDRELFNTYCDEYIRDNIFGNDVVLAKQPKEGSKEQIEYKALTLAQNTEIKNYRDYPENMLMIDSPEVFGLHANADLNFRLKESIEMINTIILTRPKESNTGGGKTREEIVQDKAKDLLIKIPIDYNMNEVKEQLKKLVGHKLLSERGLNVPLNVFLYQEIQRMQKIISIVRNTLTQIVEAIDGQIIMTPQIVNGIDSIADAKVPNTWIYDATGAEISWLLPNLGGWIGGLTDRNNQLSSWLKLGRPDTFWLTGFFNPQGFLTAMKQEVTRINKNKPKGGADKDKDQWSLDDVSYSTSVKDKDFVNIKDVSSEGVYIHGLFLEGSKWFKSMLDDPDPKKMFAPLPILFVTAVNKKKPDEKMNSSQYSCPVYKYPRKTDKYLVFRVNLNCESSASKWKLRGVSLLCSTE